SILFDMLGDFTRDRWNGFKLERNRLLNFIATHAIDNLYILTGDLHAGHAIEACLNDPTCPPLRLWEFCASPFEQAVNNLTWTRIKTQSQAIKGYKLHFIVTAHNYGVVNVSYSPNGKPNIRFSLHGSKGNKIRSIETQ
ncbi:MAG: alkaline phosphatase D family protein, partial [Anaerolineales bacterium]|nr:alkaline phosphatase D family protein [Anaerolineales bacterium]